jgi:hypothetical protein
VATVICRRRSRAWAAISAKAEARKFAFVNVPEFKLITKSGEFRKSAADHRKSIFAQFIYSRIQSSEICDRCEITRLCDNCERAAFIQNLRELNQGRSGRIA